MCGFQVQKSGKPIKGVFKGIRLVMVVTKLVIWFSVLGFEVIFRRSEVSNLRICWVCGEEINVIKVARLESLALLLGAGCPLFRGIYGRVGMVEVTGSAGKSLVQLS